MSIQVSNINSVHNVSSNARANASLQVLQGYQSNLNSNDTIAFKGERWEGFKAWLSRNRKPVAGAAVIGVGTGSYFAIKSATAPAASQAAAPAAAKGGAAAGAAAKAAAGKGIPIITPLYKGIGSLGKTIGVNLFSTGKAIGHGVGDIAVAAGKTIGLTAWSAIKIPIGILGSL